MAIRLRRDKYIIDYYPQGRGGRRVVFTLPAGTTEAQARHIEKELRTRKKNTLPTNPTGNISHLIYHYLKHCTMHQSPATVYDKRSHYKVHLLPFFGRLHIPDLTNAHIMAYKQAMKEKTYRGKPLTNRTISKGLTYLSAFLKWAQDELNITPPQNIRFRKLPHTRPMPIVLSFLEAQAFIDAADHPYKIIFKIFFYLGLRSRAARHLKWEDVDWAKRTIKTIEKGSKVKWHPIPDDLLEDLRSHYVSSSSGWVFPSPKNPENPINNLSKAVARAKKKAGITKRMYPHLLRHSIATHLLDQDVDIRQIQAFLGHSQISTTEWYAQVSMEKKRQALEKAGIKTTKL